MLNQILNEMFATDCRYNTFDLAFGELQFYDRFTPVGTLQADAVSSSKISKNLTIRIVHEKVPCYIHKVIEVTQSSLK